LLVRLAKNGHSNWWKLLLSHFGSHKGTLQTVHLKNLQMFKVKKPNQLFYLKSNFQLIQSVITRFWQLELDSGMPSKWDRAEEFLDRQVLETLAALFRPIEYLELQQHI
jgi:hypothetical protein